ncbi:Dbl homology domain-containing protein [Circinella umbellata]|nr:Dbl homology domain-containing protein [Circinella umbellata]
MTRARSAFIRSKQDRAVAIWRRSVAQLDLSSAGVISSSLSNSYSPEPISFPITDILQSNTTNHQAIQTFILNELYTTETSYHRLLDLISKKYMKPMITAMKNKDPLLIKKSGDIPILFGHLSQLLKVSQELIHSLEQRIPVEHVFITLQEELTVFLLYAVHYKTYFKTIRKACQTNVLLLSIERECLARRDTNRMGIADYLIAPIQRVPRYCLLLQDLLKHTQSTDPSYNELCTAFKMMTTLASVMNINNV